jgi:exonuclease III
VVVGDFNTTLSLTYTSSKQRINKEIQDLKYNIDQMGLLEVYRTFHTTSTQYTFFKRSHGTFSKIGHILGHLFAKQASAKRRKQTFFRASYLITMQ